MAEFFKQYYETAKQIIVKPIDFYRQMPVTGGYKEPLVFILITTMINMIGLALENIIWGSGLTIANLGRGGIMFIAIPVFTVILMFLFALLMLLFSKTVGGTGTYEAMVRVVAYANIVSVVIWIPYVQIPGLIYWLVLMVLGIREIHKFTTGKAIGVMSIPIGIILLFALFQVVLVKWIDVFWF
ncbi:YIP1 family protein [bacterium]|nr:YIP1 family protein [bacterium]